MCKCFFWCLEKFVKFINKQAYIMIAVYGKNFCFSAMDAIFLLIRNPLLAGTVVGVCSFLLFMSKLCVTAGMGILAFFFFSGQFPKMIEYVPDLNYYFIPIVIVIVSTFVIASIFFDVYDMAVHTIFFCVLEDMERHDGSPEKPYFMSSDMMRIAGKKNDFKEEKK
jgi:choline transporter-like protein 2/4/5